MRLKHLAVALLIGLAGSVVQAATLRIIVVEAADQEAYLTAVEQGKNLLKSKGSPAKIRVWKGRFAGEQAGSIIVSVEYPNMLALANDDARMASDPDLKSWFEGLDKLRTVVSDSVYTELGP